MALASSPVWGRPSLPAFAAALGHGAGIQNLRAKLNTKTEAEKINSLFFMPSSLSPSPRLLLFLLLLFVVVLLLCFPCVVYLGALFSNSVFSTMHSVLFVQLNFNFVLLGTGGNARGKCGKHRNTREMHRKLARKVGNRNGSTEFLL